MAMKFISVNFMLAFIVESGVTDTPCWFRIHRMQSSISSSKFFGFIVIPPKLVDVEINLAWRVEKVNGRGLKEE